VPGKINMRWEGPYTVVEKKGNVSYKIISDDEEKKTDGSACRSHEKIPRPRKPPGY
jgi:hypothetical protein